MSLDSADLLAVPLRLRGRYDGEEQIQHPSPSDNLRAVDGAGNGNEGPGPIWGWSTDDPDQQKEADQPRSGRLRRRATQGRREAASAPSLAPPLPRPTRAPDPPPAPASPPAPAPTEERARDLWTALAAATQRIERLSDETSALRSDMDKNFADLAEVLTRDQPPPVREPRDDADFAQALESTRTELAVRFRDDLENLTATMSDALAQVATQLERVSLLCGENRDSVEVATDELHVLSGRIDTRGAPPTTDLQPLSDAFTRLADLVEVLTRRIG